MSFVLFRRFAYTNANVITIPAALQQKMKQKVRDKDRSRNSRTKADIVAPVDMEGKMPLIVCKNKEFNHFRGLNQHLKLQEIPLATRAWTHRKATGDYITILSSKGNPAFYDLGDDMPRLFSDLPLKSQLQDILKEKSLKVATNIQIMAIPELLKGKNCLLAAETGSGKTLAYLLPVIQQILDLKAINNETRINRPLAVVVTPGRELAQQIFDVAEDICRTLPIKCKFVTGGSIARKLTKPDYEEVDLLIGTLGGLSKLTTFGVYGTDMVNHIVIDEADTMLDDSFCEKTSHYLSRYQLQHEDPEKENLRTGVQVTLVGATVPKDLEKALGQRIPVDSLCEIRTPFAHRIMPNVTQKFIRVGMTKKTEVLLDLLQNDIKKNLKTLIFSNSTATCDWLSFFLNEKGIPCASINAHTPRDVREEMYQKFKSGEAKIVSCTDIVSRGLDTLDAHHVINYDFPLNMSDYIHRVGRVGRVSSTVTGHVTSLVTKNYLEVDLVQKIEFTARRTADLPNVNANIKRIIAARMKKKGVETYLDEKD